MTPRLIKLPIPHEAARSAGVSTRKPACGPAGLTVALLLLMAGPAAQAQVPITITNAGFEHPPQAEGDYTDNDVPGWSLGYYDLSAPTNWQSGLCPPQQDIYAYLGVFNPDTNAYTCGCSPEGSNVGWTTSAAGYDVGMSQILSATLQASTTYVLSAVVSNPYIYNEDLTASNRIELVAGGVVLATSLLPSPADDTYWITNRLSYNSGPAPAQLGQALEIRILAVDFTSDYEVDYDIIQLTASFTNLTAPTITGFGPWSNGSFPVTFTGPSGQTYQVLSSTSVAVPMASWSVLTNGTFGASPATYTDTSATNAKQFYRIKSP